MKTRLLPLCISVLIIVGCSFSNSGDYTNQVFHSVDSRSVKRTDFDLAKNFDRACVTIKGVGVESSPWSEITKDNPTNPTRLSAQFKIPDLLGGYSYTLTVYAVDTDNSSIDASVIQSSCPIELPQRAGWARLGRVTIKAPEKAEGNFEIQIPFDFYQPVSNPNPLPVCAGSCYDDAAAKAEGKATGPNGTEMEYVSANNGINNFKVWKEKNGLRILNAAGLVANGWQKKLVARGDAFSTQDFESSSLIEGRVCPKDVFLDHANMTAIKRCLYYDLGTGPVSLASGGLENWSDPNSGPFGGDGTKASYYEGNISTCANKGMRLPTMYETQMQKPSANLPTGDGLLIEPRWADDAGVPYYAKPGGYEWNWTASAGEWAGPDNGFWRWRGTGGELFYSYSTSEVARCVLPSH